MKEEMRTEAIEVIVSSVEKFAGKYDLAVREGREYGTHRQTATHTTHNTCVQHAHAHAHTHWNILFASLFLRLSHANAHTHFD